MTANPASGAAATPVSDAPFETAPILRVRNLKTYFQTREGTLRALEGVNFAVEQGGVLGIVGESGCGKSVTAQSILRILPPSAAIVSGEIDLKLDDHFVDLAQLSAAGSQMRSIRGREVSMIFQEPMTSFSPVHTVGNQIAETVRLHTRCSKQEARDRAVAMLGRVGMPRPEQRVDAYPFELSGGMRQRAMIAMALVCEPRLVIADEPTTALDVTIEAQILELLRDLQREMGMSVILITHDLGVVAELARNVLVMYLGEDVEYGPVERIFYEPLHPYTRELLASIPRLGKRSREKLHTIRGTVPSLYERPTGCPFHTRCPEFMKGRCDVAPPGAFRVGDGRRVRCVLYEK